MIKTKKNLYSLLSIYHLYFKIEITFNYPYKVIKKNKYLFETFMTIILNL
jgi:hypothetical protein